MREKALFPMEVCTSIDVENGTKFQLYEVKPQLWADVSVFYGEEVLQRGIVFVGDDSLENRLFNSLLQFSYFSPLSNPTNSHNFVSFDGGLPVPEPVQEEED